MELEQIKQAVSNRISNSDFNDHEDHVRRRSNPNYCKGHEYWIHEGKTSTVEFISSNFDNGQFIAEIKLPYHAKYEHKYFDVGYGCHYTPEEKDCNGAVQFKIIKSLLGTSIEGFHAVNPDPSEAHDSTRMCLESIQEQVIPKLNNLI